MKLPSKDKLLSDLVSIAEILTAVAVVSTKTEEILFNINFLILSPKKSYYIIH